MPSLIKLTSSRLSVTPQRLPLSSSQLLDRLCQKDARMRSPFSYVENFTKVGNPFILSDSSKRKLFDSVNYMFNLSQPRLIEMKNNKKIFNFRLSFVTLTLPSKQAHDDVTIKKDFLNHFLVELRKHYKIDNYIWKAELQKNQNIHFHLILDRYVDYQALRRRWNRVLEKGGYVSKYREKMSKLSSSQYYLMRLNNCKSHNEKYGTEYNITFKDAHKAYQKGVDSNWSNPNSVDVKSVYGKKDLACYLAKYVAKQIDEDSQTDEETTRQMAFGRSWSRSYSLVKLSKIGSIEYDDIKDLITYFRNKKANVMRVAGRFFEVFYFTLDQLHVTAKKYILDWITLIAVNHGYIVPS